MRRQHKSLIIAVAHDAYAQGPEKRHKEKRSRGVPVTQSGFWLMALLTILIGTCGTMKPPLDKHDNSLKVVNELQLAPSPRYQVLAARRESAEYLIHILDTPGTSNIALLQLQYRHRLKRTAKLCRAILASSKQPPIGRLLTLW